MSPYYILVYSSKLERFFGTWFIFRIAWAEPGQQEPPPPINGFRCSTLRKKGFFSFSQTLRGCWAGTFATLRCSSEVFHAFDRRPTPQKILYSPFDCLALVSRVYGAIGLAIGLGWSHDPIEKKCILFQRFSKFAAMQCYQCKSVGR
jgi:hypothetical protein